MFYLFIFPPECNVENFRRNKESLVEGWCVRFHSYLPWSTYFLNKLPLVGFGWNIVVVLSVFLAQSYTFFTEYLGCILSGGTGKNGSTIAVSEPGKSSLLAYVLSTFFRVWLALALLRNPHIYLVMDAKHLVCFATRITSNICTVLSVWTNVDFDIFHSFSSWNAKYPNCPLGGWSVPVLLMSVTFPVAGVVELVELLLRPVAWNLDPYHLRHYWNFIYENHSAWRSRQKWIHGGCMFFYPPSLRF